MDRTATVAALLIIAVSAGCAATERISTAERSTRGDVFQEVHDGATPSRGFADLFIRCSLKTHRPGLYSARDTHGTPGYKMVVNIDGQAVALQEQLHGELEGVGEMRDPEEGEGMRYFFFSHLRLKSGRHRLVVAVPDDGVAIEREIVLREGRNTLVLAPVYGEKPGTQRPGFYGVTTFTEGLKGLEATMNDRGL